MIPVLNRHQDEIPAGAAYIGRPGIFGNPYTIKKHGDRAAVIAQFKVYFERRIKTDPAFRKAVLSLKDAPALVCFCKPLACHGDVIAAWLEGNID